MAVRLAINGFGRSGRCVVRALAKSPYVGLQIVAISDTMRLDQAAHLLKFDSTYGTYPGLVDFDENNLIIDGQAIRFLSQPEIERSWWVGQRVDVVIETHGVESQAAKKHLESGAGWILTVKSRTQREWRPIIGIDGNTIEDSHRIVPVSASFDSCFSVVATVLKQRLGFEAAMVTCLHSYAGDRSVLDTPSDDLLAGRAAPVSIIPFASNDFRSFYNQYPELVDKLAGISLNVPVQRVSLLEVVYAVSKDTSRDAINKIFEEESRAMEPGILGFSDYPLVSVDRRSTRR